MFFRRSSGQTGGRQCGDQTNKHYCAAEVERDLILR